jgi:hypothetical protein
VQADINLEASLRESNHKRSHKSNHKRENHHETKKGGCQRRRRTYHAGRDVTLCEVSTGGKTCERGRRPTLRRFRRRRALPAAAVGTHVYFWGKMENNR